jgi:hypothetical protein
MSEDRDPAGGTATEPDPEALREDLARIKDAMGIADRYDDAPEQWLLFGVVVAVGAALSQYVVLERLPGVWLFVVWFGLFGAFGAVLYWRNDGYSWGPGERDPNVGFQILVVYAAAFLVQFVAAPFLPELGYLAESAYVLGLVLVMLGVGYVVAGETLKAYHIRDRDRYAFHVGGALMALLGVAIPNVDALHEWGFAAFGATYLVYALATYRVLTTT